MEAQHAASLAPRAAVPAPGQAIVAWCPRWLRQQLVEGAGAPAAAEIDEYEEVTPKGKVIARYTVTEHTNLRGLNTTRSIQQH